MPDKVEEKTMEKVAANARREAVEAAVAEWHGTFVRNSPISRDTESWNHLSSILPELISGLMKHLNNR